MKAWVESMKRVASETSQKLSRVSIHVIEEVDTHTVYNSGSNNGGRQTYKSYSHFFEILTPEEQDVEAVQALPVVPTVQIANIEAQTPIVPILQAQIPSSTPSTAVELERKLVELDKVKAMLTQEEYENKRKEILDAL